MTNFKKNLYKLRKEKGLKQSELADILQVNSTTISDYERGKSAPDFDLIVKISEYFRVSVDFLLKNTSEDTHLNGTFDTSENTVKNPPNHPPNHPPNAQMVGDPAIPYGKITNTESNPYVHIIDTQKMLVDSLNANIQLLQDKVKSLEN